MTGHAQTVGPETAAHHTRNRAPKVETAVNKGGTMLLSRVAESVYWAGRYLERAEATARLVHVHTELFLDLPKAAGIGWTPLLALTGDGAEFGERHPDATEEEVVDFLATGTEHQGAIVTSIARAHANLRVTQAILPIEAWEVLNQLHAWAGQTRLQAVDRRTRLAWTTKLIRQCQLLSGLLEGTMSHDNAYAFLEIGRGLERADMTTRMLDVQAGILLRQPESASAYADLTWMGVLRTVSAHQMFRRTVGSTVSGAAALRFLLRDAQFPRSVERCLIEISRALLELSRHQQPMATCAAIQQLLERAEVDALGVDGPSATALHEYSDRLQGGFADLHEMLVATYFVMKPSTSTVLLSV
jgi:uncharacterized alpha-E superfamily protein